MQKDTSAEAPCSIIASKSSNESSTSVNISFADVHRENSTLDSNTNTLSSVKSDGSGNYIALNRIVQEEFADVQNNFEGSLHFATDYSRIPQGGERFVNLTVQKCIDQQTLSTDPSETKNCELVSLEQESTEDTNSWHNSYPCTHSTEISDFASGSEHEQILQDLKCSIKLEKQIGIELRKYVLIFLSILYT